MTDARLDRRFPDAAAIEAAASGRLPGFPRDHVDGGTGSGDAPARNLAGLRGRLGQGGG